MSLALIIAVLAAAISAGTPLLFSALGEVITERTGVQNLGLEGMMLTGAVMGYIAAITSGNPWIGFIVGALGGGALSLVHAVLVISFKANQVVSGLALTIFGQGFSGFIGKSYIGVPLPVKFELFRIPVLGDIPILGDILFKQDALVYFSYLLVPLIFIFLFKTRAGMTMRSLGENPAAADALGVNVFRMRYFYVFVGGLMSGMGGAYLSLAASPSWLENMTAGRGWIAIALVIFSQWNPMRAMMGAYIFGGIDALGYRLQTIGVTFSPIYLKMLPYILTIAVLIFTTIMSRKKHLSAPEALGLTYNREER
ncbi:MAG: ABC transporter permease [Clostridia bacterium]